MIRLLSTDLRVVNMRMRMPFRYGIVTLTALPHLFVRAEVEIDGDRHVGLAADHLAIKWFTKNPDVSARDELLEMRKVIETASDVARAAGKHRSVFEWWLHTYQGQAAWAGGWGIPPLLAHFGTSLMERAMIDALCKAQEVNFARALRENRFGIRLGDIHPELTDAQPATFLPNQPLRSVISRHTIGMADVLAESDITDADRINDGLPQSLEACARVYGLTYFKVKIYGDVDKDFDRIRRIEDVLRRTSPNYRFTLDANENFKDVGSFRALWDALKGEASLRDFMSRLLVVEQPLHRSVALDDATMRELRAWADRPATIIDESDGELRSAERALAGGYAGTSHKNCKGVFKSIANACLFEHRRRSDARGQYVLTAEDLCNVGPIALQQDVAVAATLGINHVERNGHHYFRGLSMLPRETVEATAERHADLYRRLPDGTPAVRIENGNLALGSVVDAPFGLAAPFDASGFQSLKDWDPDSLGIE